MDQRHVEKAIQTSSDMAAHAVADNPPPIPDDRFTSAYGDTIFYKIATTLASSQTGVKIQALERVNELVRKEENIVKCIEHDVFDQLVANFSDADPTCRRLASQAVSYVQRCKIGRDHTINAAIIHSLGKLLTDSDEGVRRNGYTIMLELMGDIRGLASVLRTPLPGSFIESLKSEKNDGIKCVVLETIVRCMRDPEGYFIAMEAEVVKTLKVTLAETASVRVQAGVCECIGYIAFNMDGKDACVGAGCIPEIVSLLCSQSDDVRVAASSALMHLTNGLSGKEAALEAGALDLLVDNISDSSDMVVANSARAVASLAEHPDAMRGPLLHSSETLALLTSAGMRDSPLVRRAIEAALAKIKRH